MKKIILPIIILSLLFGTMSLAQVFELSSPGITPDSPFYFLDTLAEKIGMFFTFGAEKKAKKALQYAEEKLAEVKVMAEKNKTQALEKANQKYQEFLVLANTKTKEAKEKGKDIEELATLITEKTLKYQEVLVEVFEKVPEEAKDAIQKAIEVSRRGSEEAVQAVTGAKKEELQKKVEEALIIPVNWNTYTNKKYGYSFKYPPDCFYGPMPVYCKEKPPEERPPECLCFLDGEDPNRAFLQAFTGENLTLATFEVTHYDTVWFNPPLGTDLIEWLKEKFPYQDIPDEINMEIDGIPAVRVYTSASPMAYSQENIYFIKNDKLFKIGMLNVDSESNRKLYNQMLSTFKFIELEKDEGEVPKAEEVPKVEEKPYIKVISPNGGEVLEEGQDYTIRWESSGLKEDEEIRITIHREDGLNGKITTVPASQNSYLWKVATDLETWGFGYFKNLVNKLLAFLYRIFLASTQDLSYKYKITIYASESGVSDQSDDYFTVIKQVPEPEITVISPNGGETWVVGNTYDITWGFEGIDKVDIKLLIYNRQNGQESIIQIASNVSASLGKYSWVIPAWIIPDFDPEDSCKIGVINTESSQTELEADWDWSDSYFSLAASTPPPEEKITVTSPNGGEKWMAGQTYDITWEAEGIQDNVEIYLRDDRAGPAYKLIATELSSSLRRYSWVISSDITSWIGGSGSTFKIQVRELGGRAGGGPGEGVFDESDGYFIIEEVCSRPEIPVLIDPGISVNNDESFTLNWTNVSNVEGYWFQRGYASPSFPEPGWYSELNSVRQTFSLGSSITFYYRVKACNDCGCSAWSNTVDMEVIVPSITVTSPNGGEEFTQGATHEIKWISKGVGDKVKITTCMTLASYEKSRKIEDRCSWPITVSNTGLYKSTIGEAAGLGEYTVKVEDADDSSIYDESDNSFSIVRPSITLTSPKGGEVWKAGETHRITWDSVGVDSVMIYVFDPSIFGSGSTQYITPYYDGPPISAASGYYDWTIPVFHRLPGIGVDFKMRIDDLNNPEISDSSDDFFSIRPNPPLTLISPNGGEELEQGKTYTIRWDGSSFHFTNPIQINLIDASVSPKEEIVIAKTTNTGSYTWTVPETIKSGSLFKIEIYVDEAGPGKNDLSDNDFSIIPSITVTSPNGGEIWEVGETYQIRWSSPGIPSNAKITNIQLAYKYTDNPTHYEAGVAGLIDNLGVYSWTIPSTIISVPGKQLNQFQPNQFLIRVVYSSPQQPGRITAEDYSDAPFTIVEK